jgi:flagellin-like hook-associated protein FlgL
MTSIGSYGSLSARRSGESFVTMRRELDDLQRQLVSGKRSETYAGLGLGRRTSLDSRAKLSAIAGYQDAITDGSFRLKLMTKGVESLTKAAGEQRSLLLNPVFDRGATGKTTAQTSALNSLKHALSVLNTDVNGRYLFAGRADNVRPVLDDLEQLFNGDGTAPGLRQIIEDRKTLERAGGNGGLTATPGASSAGLDRAAATGPGFTFPSGAPASGSANIALNRTATSVTFTVNAPPQPGETLRFELGLPDGTTASIVLTARADGPDADATSFRIGTVPETAARLQTALNAAVDAAKPKLEAASAMQSAKDFFAGTVAPAVSWYKGETGPAATAEEYSLAARSGVAIRADATQTVGVGARADEKPFQDFLASLAVMAVEEFGSTAADRDRYIALGQRAGALLDMPQGKMSLRDVGTEFAGASVALDRAKTRHDAAKALWEDAISGVEDASKEEVAASILALQTKLEASYQTTAILSRLSLVNYL